MSGKRVVSIIHFPVFGGPHNRAARIAKGLESRGWHLSVVMSAEEGNAAKRLRDAGVDVVTVPLNRVRASWNPRYHLKLLATLARDIARLRSVIRDLGADVVMVNGLTNPHGAVAARLEAKPLVWQILDTRTPPPAREGLMALVVCLADVLMVTGNRVAHLHRGASTFRDRLITFFPPVDTELFRPDADQRRLARQYLGFGEADFVVGTVGNMNPQKRHGQFIRAAARLRRDLPNARFAILGSIPTNHSKHVNSVLDEARRAGLTRGRDLLLLDPENRVHFLASAFDVFWLTAGRRSEGISTVVEEAMALGIPVVATDVGSLREAVDDAESGFIVPPDDPVAMADATLRLARDPELRQRMSVRSRNVALDRFDVAGCVDAHVRAFELATAHAWTHS
jgi:glycosyltransferase involved in cell wall biosynthesis